MPSEPEQHNLIDRREAIQRVTAILGGIALVGGSALLTGCREDRRTAGTAAGDAFTAEDIAFLDEVADTILPETKSPGAKAAKVGAFMALMVTDTYDDRERKIFREGMRKLDDASKQANGAGFMAASPQQRLALLERLDREQVDYTKRREEARRAPAAASTDTSAPAKAEDAKAADARLPDQRQENAATQDVASGAAITADSPAHYFRMMKELTLLGYFTSEIGYTKAMRYVESPGRFDPCAPYAPGEPSWAPHA